MTELIPAATVILLRDGAGGVETLMLHRSSKVAFGGMWVFPGGRVDDEDRRPDDEGDEPPARRAAVREAAEEAGLLLEPHELVPFSHWIPPAITEKRFSTWFYVARASDGDVVVDGGEIHDHAWLAPTEVLARRERGEVDLVPPTYVTLCELADLGSVDEALAAAERRRPVPRYETQMAQVEGGSVLLWAGDAGYETLDPLAPGARNRLTITASGWVLEQTA